MDSIEINGVTLERNPLCQYRIHKLPKWGFEGDYFAIHNLMQVRPKDLPPEKDWVGSLLRYLFAEDLWFLVYFGLKVSIANCPFWIQACAEVESGPQTNTLDLWAREHGKTTIITVAETIQRILRNREERICLFSYAQRPAGSFFRAIKYFFETSEIIKDVFPDVLYQNPDKEAWKWSEEAGLYVQRSGNYKEPTLMYAGLLEGMPTGFHFTGRIYDDIMTQDLINTPEIMQKVKDMFDMSQNLGTIDGWQRVIGTTYHHEDVLLYIKGKKDADGEPIYRCRTKPATIDGSPNGPSAYLPEKRLAELRTNRQMFFSQQLLNPTPEGTEKLNPDFLIEVSPSSIPKNLFKFMSVDPAGVRKDRVGDSWAMGVIGVDPSIDDVGASDIYLLDLIVEPMGEAEALDNVVKMYSRNGLILRLGVEKVGISTMEIHVSNALRARGRNVTVESGNLVLLRPAGRSKEQRVEQNLAWPLNNGKVHVSTGIPAAYRERLKLEMQKFPFWHDDTLDMLSYVFDMMKEYRFGKRTGDWVTESPAGFRIRREARDNGWLIV